MYAQVVGEEGHVSMHMMIRCVHFAVLPLYVETRLLRSRILFGYPQKCVGKIGKQIMASE